MFDWYGTKAYHANLNPSCAIVLVIDENKL